MMTEDGQLLKCYAAERSDDAFRELVARHIDLVYSAALRLAGGDSHLAQDITQNVFVDLARKASSLPPNVVLPGWLYRHACFTASKAVRTERRRQAREFTAMEMTSLTHNLPDANWEQIAPELEAAMARLGEADRDAIILRFFQRQDFHSVGLTLGISEDTAQKRVSRALDKLRALLGERGVTLPATTLAAVLTAEAVAAAPVGLAMPIAAASLAGAGATGVAFSLVKFLAMTKFKTAVAAALVVAAVTIPLLQNKSLAHLRQENVALRQQSSDLAQLRAENERLAKLKTDAGELDRLRRENADLARLRGEVTSLRRANQEFIQAQNAKSRSRENQAANPYVPIAQLADAGLDTPEASLQTFFWAILNAKRERAEQAIDTNAFVKIMHEKAKEVNPDFDPDEHHDDNFHLNLQTTSEGFAGFQILSQAPKSSEQTIIEVAFTGIEGKIETNHVNLNRIGQEWKVDMLSLVSGTQSAELSLTNTADDGKEIVTKYKVPVESNGQTGKPELVP